MMGRGALGGRRDAVPGDLGGLRDAVDADYGGGEGEALGALLALAGIRRCDLGWRTDDLERAGGAPGDWGIETNKCREMGNSQWPRLTYAGRVIALCARSLVHLPNISPKNLVSSKIFPPPYTVLYTCPPDPRNVPPASAALILPSPQS